MAELTPNEPAGVRWSGARDTIELRNCAALHEVGVRKTRAIKT